MPKSIPYTAIPVFLVTSFVWAVAVSRHTFLAREFWLYVGMFLLPALLVCVSSWLVFQKTLWLRIVGGILALPSLGVWGLSLLLVWIGFKIH